MLIPLIALIIMKYMTFDWGNAHISLIQRLLLPKWSFLSFYLSFLAFNIDACKVTDLNRLQFLKK